MAKKRSDGRHTSKHGHHGKDRDKSKPKAREGAWEFRDRSGKVHHIGGGAVAARQSERAQDRHRDDRPHREDKSHRDDKFRRPKPSRDRFEQERPSKGFHRGPKPSRHAHGEMKARAIVDKNQKGFAFLSFEDRKREDAFVPPRTADSLFHGDRVEVTLSSRGEVIEIEVLEHRFRELVGRYEPHPEGRGGWIIYERKRAREEVYVPQGGGAAHAGDWVKGKLHFHDSGPYTVTGEVTEVYGAELPASADIGMVAAEYNLIEEHSTTAVEEAQAYGAELHEREYAEDLRTGVRRDLRDIGLITIDGETARDFDDAVFVERSNRGYTLWVAIADVSHYVKPGTALDSEGRSRGTSVYFPEKAFHMLPRALSENLCSLKPNVPRLAMTAKMEFDREGRRLSTEVMESVIQSKRRATYNEIQAEWEQNQSNRGWEFAPHFELYQLIRKTRSARGSVDFDLPEAEMKVEPNGEVISIKERPRLDAHRLIEEFMIGANEAVTHWMMERSWPFVYRVHEEPALASLHRFQELAESVGVHFRVDEESASPKVLADLIRSLEGHPAQTLMNTALLRSMKQAIYSSIHGTHFGLASPGYTHFTSPIRRYPDLVVHRLLRHALQVERKQERMPAGKERDQLEYELAEVCEHCSYRERLASDAERESIKLKQVRAMTKHLGDEFDGQIVGLVESGIFVKIPDPYVEGLVLKESMTDDFYQFDEKKMLFIGSRKRRIYRIGDKVKVRCLRADIDRRLIEFGLTDHVPGPAPAYEADHKRGRRDHGRGGRGQGRDDRRGGSKGGRGRGPKGKEKGRGKRRGR